MDITKLKYSVKVFFSSGEGMDLTGLCTSLTWGDEKDSIAQKAEIKLANIKIDKGYISDLIELCTQIVIFVNEEEYFRGIVWDWNYTSALEKELSFTAYDKMIYLTQSKGNTYYSSGKSTQFLIEDICKEWNTNVREDLKINVLYEWESWTHGKTPLKDMEISRQLTTVLDEAQTKLDSKYVMLFEKDTLMIRKKGSNEDIYYFHGKNVESTTDRLTLQGLVTKVLVYGKSEEDKRPPLLKTVDGDLEYGVLQEIVTKDSNKTLDDAEKEAQNILKEKGKPEENITVSTIDVPMMRKGDKIKLVAGNLSGYFIVEGVSHDGFSKTMELELERI